MGVRLGWSTGLRRGYRDATHDGDSRYVFATGFDRRAALIVRVAPVVAILIVLSTLFVRS